MKSASHWPRRENAPHRLRPSPRSEMCQTFPPGGFTYMPHMMGHGVAFWLRSACETATFRWKLLQRKNNSEITRPAPVWCLMDVSSRIADKEIAQMSAQAALAPALSGATQTEPEYKLQECRGLALVVDDNPDITEMLAAVLRHAGYTVSSAHSAHSALDAALA